MEGPGFLTYAQIKSGYEMRAHVLYIVDYWNSLIHCSIAQAVWFCFGHGNAITLDSTFDWWITNFKSNQPVHSDLFVPISKSMVLVLLWIIWKIQTEYMMTKSKCISPIQAIILANNMITTIIETFGESQLRKVYRPYYQDEGEKRCFTYLLGCYFVSIFLGVRLTSSKEAHEMSAIMYTLVLGKKKHKFTQ